MGENVSCDDSQCGCNQPGSGDCVRCGGLGKDPDGPGEGFHGSDLCRRCLGSGSQEAGPT